MAISTNIQKLHGVDWNPNDLEQKFSASYFKGSVLGVDGKPIIDDGLIYIRHAFFTLHNHGGEGAVIHYVDKNNEKATLECTLSQLFISEDRGVPCISNVKDSAFIYLHNPERQWRRGWCNFNSFVFIAPKLNNWGDWGFSVAEKIMNPEHTHLQDALIQFKENKDITGRALNNRFWLVREPDETEIKLYRRKAFIGSFIGKKFFVRESANLLFKEELKLELPILREKYAYKP